MATAQYLLRFDDICPTQNWRVWDTLEDILLEHQIRPIVAIVPENRDPKLDRAEPLDEFWDRVKFWRSHGWSIALHGYQHIYSTDDPGILKLNKKSEFAGVPIDIQRRKLSRALDIFKEHGVHPTVWVAPAHSFDEHTVECLRELGISTISDGFSYRVFDRFGCTWVPQQLWRMRLMPLGVWTVCFHPNTMDQSAIERFARDIRRNRSRIVGLDDVLADRVDVPAYSPIDAALEVVWRLLVLGKRGLTQRRTGESSS